MWTVWDGGNPWLAQCCLALQHSRLRQLIAKITSNRSSTQPDDEISLDSRAEADIDTASVKDVQSNTRTVNRRGTADTDATYVDEP
jgi:hypothetical protein